MGELSMLLDALGFTGGNAATVMVVVLAFWRLDRRLVRIEGWIERAEKDLRRLDAFLNGGRS